MTQSTSIKHLVAQPITVDAFKPYGQVIFASDDGKSYDHDDAQLDLSQGIPRFYIMRLHQRGKTFTKITRHLRCTQCLGSLKGENWFLAVAPPSPTVALSLEAIAVFQIPGDCFVKLEIGTWHAGPYFDQPYVDFYNLELTDTNISDHDTCNLKERYGLEFEIIAIEHKKAC
jgi:ureidoglycolate hydrolase